MTSVDRMRLYQTGERGEVEISGARHATDVGRGEGKSDFKFSVASSSFSLVLLEFVL